MGGFSEKCPFCDKWFLVHGACREHVKAKHMNDYRELLIGCGAKREKHFVLPVTNDFRFPMQANPKAGGREFVNLTTLDINVDHKPDIQFNLERIDGEGCNRIPIPVLGRQPGYPHDVTPDNYYDEIHAYEVLEHIGNQGDYRKFFAQFEEFWRILKPEGLLFATVPSWSSQWAWADPSHKRVIAPGTLVFLSQREYREQVGITPMSDFRWCYKGDFETVYSQDDGNTHGFVLRAVK